MGALISAGGGKGGGRRLKPRLLHVWPAVLTYILLGTDCKGGLASTHRVLPRGVGRIFVKGEGGGV